MKLLWGTANCFTHPRYGAGAATNPDPERPLPRPRLRYDLPVGARRQNPRRRSNYVLWGGREGYETLLNTDLRQEREQIGRFMTDGGRSTNTKLASSGTLLIEPKPQEPTKHQYDYDVAKAVLAS